MVFQSFEAWESHMKRAANRMKKETGMSIGHCYEKMAKDELFKTYAAMRASYKDLLKG